MKTLLITIALLNASTVDTHSIQYEPTPISIGGHTYTIEEDYSVSYDYQGGKEFFGLIIEEDFSITVK